MTCPVSAVRFKSHLRHMHFALSFIRSLFTYLHHEWGVLRLRRIFIVFQQGGIFQSPPGIIIQEGFFSHYFPTYLPFLLIWGASDASDIELLRLLKLTNEINFAIL